MQNPDSDSSRHTAGAAIALSANGLYPLYQLGLKNAINEVTTEIASLKISRASCIPPLELSQDIRTTVPSVHRSLNCITNSTWSQELPTSIRVIERRALQSLLLDQVAQLGGRIVWKKKFESIESLASGATKLRYHDMTDTVVDLLVGWTRAI